MSKTYETTLTRVRDVLRPYHPMLLAEHKADTNTEVEAFTVWFLYHSQGNENGHAPMGTVIVEIMRDGSAYFFFHESAVATAHGLPYKDRWEDTSALLAQIDGAST